MFLILQLIGSAVLATFLYFWFTKPADVKRWLKFYWIYIYLRWINPKPPLFNFDISSKDLGELGVVPLPKALVVDNPRALTSHKHAIDGIRFSLVNRHGHVLVIQISRRHNRLADVSLFLHLADDEEYQLPLQPTTTVYNTDDKSFTASGLCLEVLEPLKRWKVNFNGYLRRTKKKDGEDELAIVKLNLLFYPLFNYVSFPEDYNPSYVADYLADKCSMSSSQFYEMQWCDSLEQFGHVRGIISVDGSNEFRTISLRGLRQRTHGFDQLDRINQRISIEGVSHNGRSFHFFADNHTDGLKNFMYGYVCPPCNMTVQHLKKIDFDVKSIFQDEFQPKNFTFDFVAGVSSYRLSINIKNDVKYQLYFGENREIIQCTYSCDMTLNGKPANGMLHFSKRHHFADVHNASSIQSLSFPLLSQNDLKTTKKLVVSFLEAECQSGQLVGGKGASLSLMTGLAQSQTQFSVPAGVCLTKFAFEEHLKQNPTVATAIQNLQKIACSAGSPSQLPVECKKVVDLIETTKVSARLREEVNIKLESISGTKYELKRYAVRSSAIGEDGEDLSAAGQNETFLGVKGLNDICSSIVKCWASQFDFRSVEYQRQNGQLLNKGMAVVIQEMVDAEVAGVLFSRDPVTGCPNKIYITANYGLGETVVSAAVDPDTIVIHRSWDDQLTLHSVQIGSKEKQINMSSEFGTVEVPVNTMDSSKCSLRDDVALKLGRIAVFLEKCFGSSRDIEWAIKDNNICLLQSRPVTTDNPTTDEEIIHEFDTGLKTDFDAYSTANVAEVFPGAASPITTSSFFRGQQPFYNKLFIWKLEVYKFDPTSNDNMMACYYGHCFFDMIAQKSWTLKETKTETDKALEVGIFGRILDDADVTAMALERYAIRPSMWHSNKMNKLIFKGMFFGSYLLNKAEKAYDKNKCRVDGMKDPIACLHAIGQAFIAVEPVMDSHFSVTLASTVWNLITLNTLANSKEFTADQYSDFGLLIGSFNGAESGNVPASLEELATTISKETDAIAFSKIPTDEALKWLQSGQTQSNKKFAEFLERHGHRGLHEFDMGCITWAMDPQQVVKAVQGMLHAGPPKIKPKVQDNNLIEQVKSPLSTTKKFLLKWIVMKGCRRAVCNREKAKSILIRTYDAVRRGYRYLGNLLVEQGYFTDPNLILFFTHFELEDLILSRSPKLMKRAKHRQRLYRQMYDYKFPEMMRGEPIPNNSLDIDAVLSGVKIKGLPVSQGKIKAAARVITSLRDVHTIQPGEILITHGTDIGWTPYFPLLSGVVTELGGLVSHGAVIARECGLPCIVGVENATQLFQTGDIVYLNATEGYLTKIDSD